MWCVCVVCGVHVCVEYVCDVFGGCGLWFVGVGVV